MADVFAGVDLRLERSVAVKILHSAMAAQPDVRRRFEAEGRAAACVSHPNLVAVFDAGHDDGIYWIVMERLPGTTLADLMASGPLPEPEAVGLVLDVLGGLAAAHTAGVIHRDIKPSNVLLGSDGRAKLADFGIAKSLERRHGDMTATNLVVGTPAFVAPERIEGQPASVRSDIWSVGVVLYEALTGVRPFPGDGAMDVARAVTSVDPVPPRSIVPAISPGTSTAVMRALARRPEDRFPSTGALSAALQAARSAGTGTGPAAPAGAAVTQVLDVAPVAWPDRLRHRRRLVGRRGLADYRRAMLAAAVVALVLLALVFLVTRGGQPARAGGFDRAAAAQRLRARAGTLGKSDGPAGPAAAGGLRQVADAVASGGGMFQAQDLLASVAGWQQQGQLSDSAARSIDGLLTQIPGVSLPPTSTSTSSTTVPSPVVAPAGRRGHGGPAHHGGG